MRTAIAVIISIGASILGRPALALDGARSRPFTVADSVNRAQLYPVAQNVGNLNPFIVSPDAKKIFFIKGKGNTAARNYHFDLLMLKADELRKYVKGKNKSIPAPFRLVSVDYDQGANWLPVFESAGIKNISFASNGTSLVYMAPDQRGFYQVFSIDIETRTKRQLTFAATHVYDYKVLTRNGSLVYSTGVYTKSTHCGRTSFDATEMPMLSTACLPVKHSFVDELFLKEPPPTTVDIYQAPLNGRGAPVILARQVSLNQPLSKMVISPRGSRAVIAASLPNPPPALKKAFHESRLYRRIEANRPPFYNPNVTKPLIPYAYSVVLDFVSGTSTAFLDIMVRPFQANWYIEAMPAVPSWIDEEKLYLPDAEYVGRTQAGHSGDSGVILDVVSRRTLLASDTAAFRHSHHRNNSSGPERAELTMDSGRCVTSNSGVDITEDGRPACYLDIGAWGIRLSTEEKYDRPPNVYATDLGTGQRKIVFELNPQYSELSFGQVRDLRWQDKTGRAWRGGLVVPPGYTPGRRYPLVVQTHGYDPNSFLIDGPPYGTAPYAAQALANRDIVVLQIQDQRTVGSSWLLTHGQRAVDARGIESAIELLDKNGVVDASRIGLIAYSATGALVFNMAVFPKIRPRAIIIADSVSPSPLAYAMYYWSAYQGMETVEIMHCGATPWGATQSEWIRRNPYYHMDALQTPVLIEKFAPFISDWWDVFSGLKRLDKPVELAFFNSTKHPPLEPDVVLESKTLTVDWMDFWLTDRERADESLADRYSEWRNMRDKIDLTEASKPSATPFSEMDCDFSHVK